MPHEQPIKLEINEGLKEAVDLFHSTNEVSLSLFTPNEPVYTYMDAGHFARVMNNLIKNAIQAMLPGKLGVIVISCKKEDHKIVIEVRDNGSGIPEELRDKIFTPNFSTKTSGMGLGLAIIKNIIERAGGSIRFDTKLGEGTSFFIIIPEYHNPKELK
jgi:signal transduction histidine kinase